MNYSYDRVQIYLWTESDQELVLETADRAASQPQRLALAESGLLGYTL